MELKIRILYQHDNGKVFYCIGVALDIDKKEQVIISSVDTGIVYVRPMTMFIDGVGKKFNPILPKVE